MEEELTPEIIAARAKLRERFGEAPVQIGGKGTARRKPKKVHKGANSDDKKLQLTLKKLGCTALAGIEEVLFFQNDQNVMVFSKPRLAVAPAANTYVVGGEYQVKSEIEALMHDYQNILGKAGGMPEFTPEMLQSLTRPDLLAPKAREELIASFQKPDEDDDIPELVEDFEAVSKEKD